MTELEPDTRKRFFEYHAKYCGREFGGEPVRQSMNGECVCLGCGEKIQVTVVVRMPPRDVARGKAFLLFTDHKDNDRLKKLVDVAFDVRYCKTCGDPEVRHTPRCVVAMCNCQAFVAMEVKPWA